MATRESGRLGARLTAAAWRAAAFRFPAARRWCDGYGQTVLASKIGVVAKSAPTFRDGCRPGVVRTGRQDAWRSQTGQTSNASSEQRNSQPTGTTADWYDKRCVRPWVAPPGWSHHVSFASSTGNSSRLVKHQVGGYLPIAQDRGFASTAEASSSGTPHRLESRAEFDTSERGKPRHETKEGTAGAKQKKPNPRKPKSKQTKATAETRQVPTVRRDDAVVRRDDAVVRYGAVTYKKPSSKSVSKDDEQKPEKSPEQKLRLKLEKQNAKLHRRSKETSKRLRSGKRQSLGGMQTWVLENEQRLDRFTIHLACKLVAQHAAIEKRKKNDHDRGVFRIGNFKVNVIDGRDEETVSNSAQIPTASRANKALWTAIGRIAGEVTNGHEWSRLLDATARLLKAGVGDDFGDVGVGGLDKDVIYSDLVKLATLNATQSGTQFAKECAPSDVVGNLRALVWISESKHSGSISKNGANAIAQAAYTKAVEMSDFELKSAIIFLDSLCKVEKSMEGKGNGNTVSTFGGAFDGNAPNDNNTSGKKKKKKGTKNSAVEKKTKSEKLVDNLSFADGFVASRALVKSVIAARQNGTLLSISRKRPPRKLKNDPDVLVDRVLAETVKHAKKGKGKKSIAEDAGKEDE